MKKILLPLLGILFIINGCASISASKNAQKRSELDAMAGSTITQLFIQYPDLQSEIENAPGYMVAHINTPAANGGEGVLIVNASKEPHYFTIGGLKIGSGWGTHSFKILLVLKTQKILDSFKDGKPALLTEVASTENSLSSHNNKYTVYVMSDGGVAVTSTVKILDFKINHELGNL